MVQKPSQHSSTSLSKQWQELVTHSLVSKITSSHGPLATGLQAGEESAFPPLCFHGHSVWWTDRVPWALRRDSTSAQSIGRSVYGDILSVPNESFLDRQSGSSPGDRHTAYWTRTCAMRTAHSRAALAVCCSLQQVPAAG